MTNIEITIITAIALILVVVWLTKPYRCSKCGGAMEDVYDENGCSWKVCTKCGYSELVGKEDDNGNTVR